MPKDIHRDEARRLLSEGAQVVEVLQPAEYERRHLPGAINIPLRKLDRLAPEGLASDRPVVVYCFDYQ